MENFKLAETLDYDHSPAKGFYQTQLPEFSADIEASGAGKDNPNKSQPDEKETNEGGPRPPKKEDFPDEEKEELFSEVSDPEEED